MSTLEAMPKGPGSLVDDLELQKVIARGGSGVIQLAKQASLDREVVIKSLLPGRQSPRHVDALLREAAVAGRLDHPNIVPVHALGRSPDGPFLVMKRVEGASWAEHLDEVDRTTTGWLRQQLSILMDLCRAIEFAHARRIVHRDIKPANVMLGSFGEVFLLDWGAALRLDEDSPSLRQELVGTPGYMAPELVEPDGVATPRTDVYLLGACLCQVLTGHPPHAIGYEGGGVSEILERARASAPVPFEDDVHPLLAEMVHTACAKDPKARYGSVSELREAIGDYLHHQVSITATERADALTEQLCRQIDQARDIMSSGASAVWSTRQIDADTHIQRRYSACRFAYEQALDQWPGNSVAAEGLGRLIALMAEYEIGRANVASAGALLSELPRPPQALVAQLDAVKQQERAKVQALKRVHKDEAEARFHGVDWVRSQVAFWAGVFGVVMGWLLGNSWRAGDLDLNAGHVASVFAFGGFLTALTALLWRGSMVDSRRFRRFLLAFFATFLSIAAMELTAWVAEIPVEQTWAAVCFMAVASASTLAVTIERAMWFASVLGGTAGIASMFAPNYGPDIIGGAFFVNGVWMAWVLRPRRASDSP